MRNREQQKKPNWIALALVLLLAAPEFVIPIGIFAGIVYLVMQAAKKKKPASDDIRNVTYARKPEALDDCPKPLFCFHKDKGEHHVQRGREIDPWDRPDIDIRKYQRKQ